MAVQTQKQNQNQNRNQFVHPAAQTQNYKNFRPGERIAVPALPVLKFENDIAILKKTRIVIQGGCGARHQVRVESPFMVRGGFRVTRISKFKVPQWAFTVVFETPWGTTRTVNIPQRTVYLDRSTDSEVALAEALTRQEYEGSVKRIIDVKINEPIKTVEVYVRRFKHATVEIPADDYFGYVHGPHYFVYEFVSHDEAKLVDDIDRIDYVLHVFDHNVSSRVGCATIKVLGGDVVWHDIKSTCCATTSYAAAMIITRNGTKIVIAKNRLPYRGCCEEWEIEEWLAELPPRRLSQYSTTEPVATSISPEEVA